MMTITPLVAEFTAVGQLKDLSTKSDGRIKYLLVSTKEEEYWVKVPKQQPKHLARELEPGCSVKVTGMLKRKITKDLTKDRVEYKAYGIEVLNKPQLKVLPTKSAKTSKKPAKVLICKKSNCWNKGGKAVCKLLESELAKKGLEEQVIIKTTGCLKKCKQAPNVVVLPDKKQYVRVKPKQISAIIDRHLV